MRNLYLLVFCLYFFLQNLWAQSPAIDSLKNQLENSQGEKRVDLLNACGYVILSYDYIESTKLIDEALALSKKLNYENGLAESIFYKGVIQQNIGQDSVSLRYFREALKFAGSHPAFEGAHSFPCGSRLSKH